MTSRFLTTAMLPKLQLIRKRRSILVILATNHIDKFDFAIRRSGRFDLVLQVMPPTLEEKRQDNDDLERLLKQLSSKKVDGQVGQLTYLEYKELVADISEETNSKAFKTRLGEIYRNCTLNQSVPDGSAQKNGGQVTWAEKCKSQKEESRLFRTSAPPGST